MSVLLFSIVQHWKQNFILKMVHFRDNNVNIFQLKKQANIVLVSLKLILKVLLSKRHISLFQMGGDSEAIFSCKKFFYFRMD